VFRKTTVAGAAFALMVLAVGLMAVASASASSPRRHAQKYRVVRHARSYDVVRGHHRTLVVRDHFRYVSVRGVNRFRVVKRTHTFVLLESTLGSTATPTATPTPTSTLSPANFQTTLAAAHNGDTFAVPAGTYAASTISIPDGVTLIGAGMDSAWLKGEVLFGSHDAISGLKIGDAGTTAVRNRAGATATTFSSCRFRGGKPGAATGLYSTVVLGDGSASCDHITFTNCEIERNLGNADDFNVVEDGTSAGGAHVDSITLNGCHIGVSNGAGGHDTGSPSGGIELYTWDGGSGTALHGWSNIKILNSVIEATDSFCVDLADYPLRSDPSQRASGPVTISGCTLKGGGYGSSAPFGYTIAMEAPKGVVIENNTIYRGRDNTIGTGASSGVPSNYIIRNNNIDMDFDNGIPVANGQYPIVLGGAHHRFTGNTIIGHTGDTPVVTLADANGCVVTGNRFAIGGRVAIQQISGSSGNTLSPNKIK
jgi:hypothetical protein